MRERERGGRGLEVFLNFGVLTSLSRGTCFLFDVRLALFELLWQVDCNVKCIVGLCKREFAVDRDKATARKALHLQFNEDDPAN